MDYEFEWLKPAQQTSVANNTSPARSDHVAQDCLRTRKDATNVDNQQLNTNNNEKINIPCNIVGGLVGEKVNIGSTTGGALLSDAKGQGILSGFGSGAQSQNIMSLGEKT
uniref:Uncharacterized protein n=1 Tax=Lygus hesperus TaxID=30085 RepID=A0A146M968_LYGHE